MKVQGAWIEDAATQVVCDALTSQGFQTLFVGGCVRNALLGVDVSDIDIATDATPEDVVECARLAGLKSIPTGIDHGTITVVSAGIPHELTTFRSDTETDGRHAKVRFSKSILEDAARRDFTMNAIYADPAGFVVDPLNGIPDLNARHVRFIGDAEARIREDYLRSLRFFRFTAWYGDPGLGIDPDGLAAVAANLDGLEGLSRERVGSELKKLMTAANPAMAVAAMRSSGVLHAVLPSADDRVLGPLIHLEQSLNIAPDPIRRLSALTTSDAAKKLRLSKLESKRWAVLRDEVETTKPAAHLGYLHGSNTAKDVLLLRSAFLEMPINEEAIQESNKGEIALFPIKAKDLPHLSGCALGEALTTLEQRWIASGFTLSRDELLA